MAGREELLRLMRGGCSLALYHRFMPSPTSRCCPAASSRCSSLLLDVRSIPPPFGASSHPRREDQEGQDLHQVQASPLPRQSHRRQPSTTAADGGPTRGNAVEMEFAQRPGRSGMRASTGSTGLLDRRLGGRGTLGIALSHPGYLATSAHSSSGDSSHRSSKLAAWGSFR